MAKTDALIASAAKSMADSTRSLSEIAMLFEKTIAEQNSLLGSVVDKLGDIAKSVKKAKDKDKGAGAAEKVAGKDAKGKDLGILKSLDGLKGEEGKSLADNLAGLGSGLSDFSKGLTEFAKASFKMRLVPDKVLLGMADSIVTIASKFSEIKGKNLKTAAEGISIMAKSIIEYAKAAIIFLIIPQKPMLKMTEFIVTLSEELSKIKGGKELKTAAESLGTMGKAVLDFGVNLALSTVLYAIGALGSIIIVPVIMGYAKIFEWIGGKSDDIQKGAKALAWVGLGLLSLGLGLLAVQLLGGGSWAAFGKGVLMVTLATFLFAEIFSLYSKMSPDIEKGAIAFVFVGVALASLALGIASFRFFEVDAKSVLLAGAAVFVVGIAFALIGAFGTQFITPGAVAMAFAGLSLVTLALGLGSFRLFKIGPSDYLNAAAAVVAVGGAMALAGLMSPAILLGGLALAVASLSLIFLAVGLLVINLVYKFALDGVLGTPKGSVYDTHLERVVVSVADAFSLNPMDSVFMLAGALAIMAVSVAMIVLSIGLFAMNLVYKKSLDGILGIPKNSVYHTNLDKVVGSVTDAFSLNPIDSALMFVGAVALLVASAAMITLSVGLLTFNFVYKKTSESKLFEKKGKTTPFEDVMDSIVSGFSISLFDSVKMGVGSVSFITAGLALISVAAGLGKFQSLVEKNIDVAKIGGMVNTILTAVASSFMDVGSGDAEVNGKKLDWDKVEDGIDAVSDVGNLLSGMADGVAKMAELKFPQYDKDGKITGYFTVGDDAFANVSKNIALIITAIAGTFTEIGAKQGKVGWFDKTDAETGAEAIRGVGGDLVGLADFVMKAADLKYPKFDEVTGKVIEGQFTQITPAMLDPKTGTVAKNIRMMIEAVAGAFAAAGKGDAAMKDLFGFGSSEIDKGKEVIKGIGADVTGIADMVVKIASIQDFEGTKKRVTEIPQMLTGMFKALTSIGGGAELNTLEKFSKYMTDLADTATPMESLAKSFETIAKSMGSFGKTFGVMKPDTLKNSTMLIQSLVTFSKVDPAALDSLSDKGKALINYIYEKGTPTKKGSMGSAAPATAPAVESPKQPGIKTIEPKPAKEKEAPVNQMQQVLTDLTTQMTQISAKLTSIDAALHDKLRVVNVTLGGT